MAVFGGAVGGTFLFFYFLGGGLADDNLYALDLKNGEDAACWLQISVVGHTPGRRYGHCMVFIKPFLLVHGGNTGTEPVNDVWSLNLEKAPYNWFKLETGGEVKNIKK
jgi:protein phosphatase